ncbi:hypothetical protein [Mesorhizobium sp.]|uniref:hypothetical protein n=1 Tax=Mesorhizobium sp. TaxID=1871066 RepID=UPI0025BFA3CB|nr:hypothetical protein [Mesorhizobium sp.]
MAARDGSASGPTRNGVRQAPRLSGPPPGRAHRSRPHAHRSRENLHRAKHLKKSEIIKVVSRKFVNMGSDLLDCGAAAGVFRPGIDAVQLNITIAAIGYYYLTNRFTGSIIFERDLMGKEALAERLSFNTETIIRLVCVQTAR